MKRKNMRRRGPRILSILLVLCLALSLLPGTAWAAEVVASGKCGENVTWMLRGGVLTISGTGDMHDYNYGYLHDSDDNPAPWYEQCNDITEVVIENGVTSIGGSAFEDCSSLTTVDISDSVTTIEYRAFAECSSLTSVTIPDNVTSIGNGAFAYCESLTSVDIPVSVTSIGVGAFSATPWQESLGNFPIVNGILLKYQGEDWDVTIPDGVTTIVASAFSDCSFLRSVTIPDSVTTIGDSAFYNCTALISANIPDGVAIIETATFYDCESLTSVTIPYSVTSIGDGAFYECNSLTSVNIPEGVATIGFLAFYNCTGLTGSLVIPDSVTYIDDRAFVGCSGLTSVIIPNSVTSIEDGTFFRCSNLTSVNIPDSVTYIGDGAFQRCKSLTSVTIPDSVTRIENYAFYECGALTDVYYSGSEIQWKQIDIDNDYGSNGNLLNATIHYNYQPASGKCGENVTWTLDAGGTLTISGTGDMYFYNGIDDVSPWPWWEQCDKITAGVIGSGVTSIGKYVFMDCINLTSVTIPNGVTDIGDLAFSDCSSLTSVTIPNSVTDIGPAAFHGCESLTDVYYGGSENQWKQIFIADANAPLLNANIHYNSLPDAAAPDTPVVCGKYASDYTAEISFDGSDFTFTLSSLGDKSVPENTAAWQAIYNESGQLVSIKRLPSAKDGSSGISFKGSVSAAGGQKCSMFVLDGNSAPIIEKYILS